MAYESPDYEAMLRNSAVGRMADANAGATPAPKKKRKRGGLAGIWDRNKGAIGSVAGGLAASFIPGVGALLAPSIGGMIGGAAARGKLDTGNLMGDALGGMGGANVLRPGAAALKNAFVPKAAGAATSGAATMASGAGAAAPMTSMSAPMGGVGAMPPVPAMPMAAPSLGQRAMQGVKAVGSFAKDNPEVLGMAAQGVGGAMQAGANRDIARDQLAQRNTEFTQTMDFERRRQEEEDERKRNIGNLLAPLYQQFAGRAPMGAPVAPMMSSTIRG